MLLSETSGSIKWKVIRDQIASGNSDYEVGINLRETATRYNVGDIVYDDHIPTYMRLRCVTAGVSGTSDLEVS